MNDFINKYVKLEPQQTTLSMLFMYMSIAYLFGLAVRMMLWYQVAPIESFWLDGNPIPIYSPDAGLYGYYAKQLLSGVTYPMTAEYMPGYLIYWLVGIFSLNIDWVMFLLPAFLAPLVAIPIVLMAHAYHQAKLGFFAALIGVIGINFYTRSYLGYMDTDTLNLFFPYMAIASLMMAMTRRSWLWGVGGVVALIVFYFWYHSSIVIIAAIGLMALLLAPLLLRSKKIGMVAFVLIMLGMFFVDLDKVTQRASDYMHKSSTIVLEGKDQSYHFENTLESVAEAQQVDIFSVHEHYLAMMPYVLLATLGFVLLSVAQPAFLVALPMIALGYAATFSGMRFTMFATPIFALGFVGLFFVFAQRKRYLGGLMAFIAVGLMITNILRVNPSFTPMSFTHNDVQALEKFAAQTQQKDLLISWWDYGWPLWYYTGRNNTLVDNGRHGADTYLVANLLLSKDDAFVANALGYFGNKQQGNSPILPHLIHQENLKERFKSLKNHPIQKKPDRDIYFLLHRDMLLTFKTIEDFAYIDISNGEKIADNSQFFISDLVRPYSKKEPLVRGDTFDFDLRDGMIRGHDGASTQIQGVIITDKGKVTAAKRYNSRSSMNLIIYNKTKAIYLDNRALDTFLIKALLFDQYNKDRFEKVADTDRFKIFKVK